MMTSKIQPIETHYNGYRFRSRLEARWAVFFDKMGVEYQYEPEGYCLPDGKRYLPDFSTKNFWNQTDENVFWEIKPQEPTHEEWQKAASLSYGTKQCVDFLIGAPGDNAIIGLTPKIVPETVKYYTSMAIADDAIDVVRTLVGGIYHNCRYAWGEFWEENAALIAKSKLPESWKQKSTWGGINREGHEPPYYDKVDYRHYGWTVCDKGHLTTAIYIDDDYNLSDDKSGKLTDQVWCPRCDIGFDSSSNDKFLQMAFAAARSARFEFGESGIQ